MADIVPKLAEAILTDFEIMVSENRRIQKILSGDVADSTMADVSELAGELGHYAAMCLRLHYKDNALPDGTLYWNIAKRTITPLMKRVYDLVVNLADVIQKKEDTKLGIGIKPVKPEFNEERIDAVINKILWTSKAPEVTRNE